MARPASDKRERLVAAAVAGFHRQGFARTSLADVARAAGLSPGHVFYYFRTKEELARAVIDDWCDRLAGRLAALDGENDHWRRLERFIDRMIEGREVYVGLGCPLAGLARDLRRESEALRAEVARVYAVQEAWARAQFAELGFDASAAEAHARAFIANYHGSILLAYAQDDEDWITGGAAALRDWLNQLREESRGRGAVGKRRMIAGRTKGRQPST